MSGICVPASNQLDCFDEQKAEEVPAPLFYYMVERVHRFVLLEGFCTAPFASSECSGELFGERFVLPEFPENRLVCEVRNIFGIVERRGGARAFIGLFTMARLTRKDACEDGSNEVR